MKSKLATIEENAPIWGPPSGNAIVSHEKDEDEYKKAEFYSLYACYVNARAYKDELCLIVENKIELRKTIANRRIRAFGQTGHKFVKVFVRGKLGFIDIEKLTMF